MGMMPEGPPPDLSDIERRVLGGVTVVRSRGYTPSPTPIPDVNQIGPTPGALQGDEYPITYDPDGYPLLPECLKR